MIGSLRGKIQSIAHDHLIVDVGGVGYLVFTNISAFDMKVGDELFLHIETIVREDQISLYGFKEVEEKDWFKLLQTVQGVGARMAISILSAFSPSSIAGIILSQDLKSIKSISGVGNKLATRILNELKDKPLLEGYSVSNLKRSAAVPNSAHFDDALSALSNLGFNKAHSLPILQAIIDENPEIGLSSLIRAAISKLGK
jgi:Holliday junction DNA helicase RuvA